MSARMVIGLTLIVALLVLLIAAYRVMIDVKPRVSPPGMAASAHGATAALENALMGHVQMLGEAIGERHLGRPHALQAAADYIRDTWTSQGWSVTEERFEVGGKSAANLYVEQPGSNTPEAIVLVGAHYDTAPGSPGANDNGTGVALLLEMARALRSETLPRTIRYVAFANEEPPYSFTESMGSRVHARGARRRNERIVAMVSLETLGYYVAADGTQGYPFPLGLFYPRTGNFLAVVGNLRSRGLVVAFLRHFMSASPFPVEGAATFEWIPGITWSDHWSFWKEGYPAIMLTDTAPFRYPEYHRSGDVPRRLTAPEFARAAHGIIAAVRALATVRQESS